MDVSAVCQYQIEDVQKVFEGPYKEYREQSQKWGRYSDQVPSPRPGAVSTARGEMPCCLQRQEASLHVSLLPPPGLWMGRSTCYSPVISCAQVDQVTGLENFPCGGLIISMLIPACIFFLACVHNFINHATGQAFFQ